MAGDWLVRVPALVSQLAMQRPVFHSEADFQHALAWLIAREMPEAGPRLEVPLFGDSRDRVDIVVRTSSGLVPIELKYWQAPLTWTADDGEQFRLVNQSAQDMHRAAFAKDIMRIERAIAEHRGPEGWVVALTNDSSYWRPGRSLAGSDAAFRLNEGRELRGRLEWRAGTSSNTTKGTLDIELKGRYPCHWAPYSHVTSARGEFRTLVIRVPGQ